MVFEVKGKVALITGASNGLGYEIAKKFLQEGAKGICLADVDEAKGQAVEEEFQKKFGKDCCFFVYTDVASEKLFDETFQKTLEKYNQLDIVINNAAIINETKWTKCIHTNLIGCLNGTKLAIDTYLPKHKSGDEAVLVNMASIVGLEPMSITPVYCATKHGIVAVGRCYGDKRFYDATKVRVLTVCPGHMMTPMILEPKEINFNNKYRDIIKISLKDYPIQEADFVADSLIGLINDAESGSVWVIEDSQPPYQVEFKDRKSMRKC